MKTAIDSSVLFEILKRGPLVAQAQRALEQAASAGAVTASAVVVAEVGRYFDTAPQLLRFLSACALEPEPISVDAALTAASIMRTYAKNKGPRVRVAPDFLVGAHALRQADALLTTDAGFFRTYFKGLKVVTP